MPGTAEEPALTCKEEGIFFKSQERRYCSQVETFPSLYASLLEGNSFVLSVLIQIQCPSLDVLFQSPFTVAVSTWLVGCATGLSGRVIL